MQTGNTDYICKDDFCKACFQHAMAYGKFKDLAKRTQSYKVFRDKAFEIAINPKCGGYQRGLSSIIYLLKVTLKMKLHKINNLQISFMNQLLENWKEKSFFFI